MGYLFLAIASTAGITKGYCGKRMSEHIGGSRDAVFLSVIRMLFCILISLAVSLLSGGLKDLQISPQMVPTLLLSGISNGVFLISWLLAVRGSAYLLVNTVLTFSVSIPVVLSAIFFRESICLRQIIGFAVLCVAVITMSSYSKSVKGKFTVSGLVALLAAGISSGLESFSQKIYVYCFPSGSTTGFQFYTFLMTALLLTLYYLLFERKNGTLSQSAGALLHTNLGYVAALAICLFVNSIFRLKAAAYLSSMEMYPLSQGASLVLSALIAAVCFHEKPNRRSVIGMLLTAAGLTIINILTF